MYYIDLICFLSHSRVTADNVYSKCHVTMLVGVLFNLQIPMIDKHKPVPVTTYQYPKDQEILDQVKEQNHKASQVWKVF